MFNRGFVAVPVEPRALEARRSVAELFTRKLRELPPAPLDFAALESWVPLPGCHELRSLYLTAFQADAGQPQLDALWQQSLATALCSARTAGVFSAQPSVSAAAALLHRIGDALTLRALFQSEAATGVALDTPSRATLVSQHTSEVAERVLRWWGIPAPVAATALGWRRFGEFPAGSGNCAAVYVAHLLAMEWLDPTLCAPGIVTSVAEELGVSACVIAAVRPDADLKARLARLPGIALF